MSRRVPRRKGGQVRGGRGGGTTTIEIPDPDLHLIGSNADFTSNLMTAWFDEVAALEFEPTVAGEPTNLGPTANGIAGVHFPLTKARCHYAGTVKAGTHDRYAVIRVMDPEEGQSPIDRQYDTYWYNSTSGATSHIAHGQTCNDGGVFRNVGAFFGTWTGNIVPVSAEKGLQVVGILKEPDGTISVWRISQLGTQGLLGTQAGSVPADLGGDGLKFADVYIGANEGAWSPSAQALVGTIYEAQYWLGTPITASQIVTRMAELAAQYSVSPLAWRPTDQGTSGIWLDTSLRRATSSTVWHGGVGAVGLADWRNQLQAFHFTQTVEANRPGGGAEIDGRSTVDFDGAAFFLNGPLATRGVANNAYHMFGIVRVDSVAAKAANDFDDEMIVGDNNGNFWVTVADVAGTPKLICGHISGGVQKSVQVDMPALGTPFMFEVIFTGGVISARINNGSFQTIAAGNITSVAGAWRMGSRTGAAGFFDGQVATFGSFTVPLTGTQQTNARAYLNTFYPTAAVIT